jgi:DNA polymerase-3 subunit beta
MQAQINLKHVLAALNCVSTEETRYYLQGVCIEVSERASLAVATDGHVLLATHCLLDTATPDNTLLGSFILSSESLKAVKIKHFFDPLATLTQVDAAVLKITCGAGSAWGYPNGADFYVKLVDGSFPDWRRVIPMDTDLKEAQTHIDDMDYDIRKLAQFSKAAAVLNGPHKRSGNPFSLARGGDGPALVRFGDESNVIGAIMPCRSGGAQRGKRPDWI